MQILMQSYRPTGQRPLYRQKLRDAFVNCPMARNPVAIERCVKCGDLAKLNINSVRCNHVR